MIIQRSLTTIVALAALSFSLLAQPHIDLRPDRTVFFYAKDAKAAVAAVQNDPVMAKDVEALGIPMQNSTGMDQHETIDKSGTMAGVSDYCRMDIYRPRNPSGKMVIVCPGGAYVSLAYGHEGEKIARYFNSKGITAVVLKYRVPLRLGQPKHMIAWQDAQRCVRVCRARAEEWGVDPNKIGIMGFSAGGHLALLIAASSQTNAYEPVDDIDKLPCNVNFAVPVYPAWVLKTWDSSSSAKEFAFDEATPPMCLVHGDADFCTPIASAAVYKKLREMNIPAELHIYAKVKHGFGGSPTDGHIGDWLNRVCAWMNVMGF